MLETRPLKALTRFALLQEPVPAPTSPLVERPSSERSLRFALNPNDQCALASSSTFRISCVVSFGASW